MNDLRHLTPLLALALAACSSEADPIVLADGAPSSDGNAADAATTSDATSPPPPSDGSSPPPVDGGVLAALSTECVNKTTAYRAKLAVAPLARKEAQESCAYDQARKGATDLKNSGTTTFHKYFGQCTEAYQKEGWFSQDDPSAVVDWCLDAFFKEGPPKSGINHYSVMTDPKSTLLACSLFHMEGGGYWMTQDYYAK